MKRFAAVLFILVALLFAAAFSTALTVKKFDDYRIVYDLQGGTNSLNNPSSYTTQDSRLIYLAAPTRDGFDFLGWYQVSETGKFSNEEVDVINTSEKKDYFVYAKWGLKPKNPSKNAKGCYQIYTAEELYGFARLMEAGRPNKSVCVDLRKDVVVNRKVLKSNGLPLDGTFIWWKAIKNFDGVFEGNGFTISGLYGDVGLFENLGEEFESGVTTVRNLGIVDSYFEGRCVGTIAGHVGSGVLLYSVYSTATVKGNIVGGLVGSGSVTETNGVLAENSDNSRFVIKNSYNAGLVLVTEGNYGGGLVGVIDAASLVNVFNVGPVNGEGNDFHVDELVYPSGPIEIKNGFAFSTVQSGEFGGETVTADDFAEGNVFAKLSKGKEDGPWMQNVGEDLYPKLKNEVEYIITYSLNGGVNSKENPSFYTVRSSDIVFEPPEKEGDVFEGWFADASFRKRMTKIDSGSTGYVHLYAKWKNEFKINYRLFGGRNSWKNPTYWNADSSEIELQDPVRLGYDFEGWFLDKKFKKRITVVDSGSHNNMTLYAKWSPKEYRITYHLKGGHNGGLNPGFFSAKSESVFLREPVREGYQFGGWLDLQNQKSYKKIIRRKDLNRPGVDEIDLQAIWLPVEERPGVDTAGCFAITNRAELYWYAEYVGGELDEKPNFKPECASLQNDIVVNENVLDDEGNFLDDDYVTWNPIQGRFGAFEGDFYGNGFAIYGLYNDFAEDLGVKKYAGFFGDVSPKAKVKDLFIRNSYFNGEAIQSFNINSAQMAETVRYAVRKILKNPLSARNLEESVENFGVQFFDAMGRSIK